MRRRGFALNNIKFSIHIIFSGNNAGMSWRWWQYAVVTGHTYTQDSLEDASKPYPWIVERFLAHTPRENGDLNMSNIESCEGKTCTTNKIITCGWGRLISRGEFKFTYIHNREVKKLNCNCFSSFFHLFLILSIYVNSNFERGVNTKVKPGKKHDYV